MRWILWLNDGSGTFSDSGQSLGNSNTLSVFGADVDNDGDIDFIEGNDQQPVYVWLLSSQVTANTAPNSPSGLGSVVSAPDVTLSWTDALDNATGIYQTQTPANLMTYNIRVGTTSGGYDVVSPFIGAREGNIGHHTSWTIKGLSSGTYYWSIQTIDADYMRSPWAAEESFIIP